MRRIIGIIIFAVGLLLLLSSILHLLPVSKGIGIFSIFIGLVVFGLSFIPQPTPGPDAPPPLSPAERILNVFYDPQPVFQNLRYHPRWLAGFLVLALFTAAYQIAFVQRLTPERIAADQADKVINSGFIPPDRAPAYREQQIEDAKAPATRIVAPFSAAGGLLLFMLVLAALYLLCVLAFGGRINFWQALSVAVYGSLPPIVISSLVSVLLLYLKSPDDIDVTKAQRGLARADLGVLFSPQEHPYLFVIGSAIGLFSLYGWWLTVTGLRWTSEKLSTGSAWAIAFALWLLGLLILLVLAMLFPSFVG
jgi:hypothetical protein